MSTTVEKAIQELKFSFPTSSGRLDQDEEFLILEEEDGHRKIRFHDYNEIYDIPGLYEAIFYNRLKCKSPDVIVDMLKEEMEKEGEDIKDLNVFDFGAGNGIVAEVLRKQGVEQIVGADLIPEAKSAALRDRPEVYEEYHTMDCCDITPENKALLNSKGFNAIVTVAALGYGDVPPRAFANSFNAVEDGGWCAFNIRDKFIEDENSDFKPVIDELFEKYIDLKNKHKYVHRYSIEGTPLHYYAVVGRKKADMPLDIAE